MTRLIVKNLPKNIKQNELQKIFSKYGHITECKLKYTHEGVFRKFAFIGYKDDNSCHSAVSQLHNTFIHTSKINIQEAFPIGSKIKPQSWSKYSKDSTEYKNNHQDIIKKLVSNSTTSKKPNILANIDQECLKNNRKKSERDKINYKVELDKEISDDEDFLKSNVGDIGVMGIKETKKIQNFRVSIKGLSFGTTKNQISMFFAPLKIVNISMLPMKHMAIITFSDENSVNVAIKRNKTYIDKNKVFINKINDTSSTNQVPNFKNGRLFIRNLSYSVVEKDLTELFSKYGDLTETNLPIDLSTNKPLGFAFISYLFPENAIKAFENLDGSIFQGRMLHIIEGQCKKHNDNDFEEDENLGFKQKKDLRRKKDKKTVSWNSLFLGIDDVNEIMSTRLNTAKSELLNIDSGKSSAVRVALAETQLVNETRTFLIENGVLLDSFCVKGNYKRSNDIILAKNLSHLTTEEDLQDIFSQEGKYEIKIILPPSGISALIMFDESSYAKVVFNKLSYKKFYDKPLYLEWAPLESVDKNIIKQKKESQVISKSDQTIQNDNLELENENFVLFIKNLNFDTDSTSLTLHFKKTCDGVKNAIVSGKVDVNNPGKMLSMGYGFVEFNSKKDAEKALIKLQNSKLDGHNIQIKKSSHKKPTNVPFEAKKRELYELFRVFGDILFIRIPKKYTGDHRGFAFVEFKVVTDATVKWCPSDIDDWSNLSASINRNKRKNDLMGFLINPFTV
ncbi:Multiple RNA-binding domain-containing protein 1 [Intoshia linei]|uniref:Multiple RNA-binding domain-containing protein 1 n=1 Tax=Intoshia linei TaxID=1819745 RepID=A0A177B5P5_9BILA|nr:Multiple RNA-binding domain-containing protein 1 [Intoshia linei]